MNTIILLWYFITGSSILVPDITPRQGVGIISKITVYEDGKATCLDIFQGNTKSFVEVCSRHQISHVKLGDLVSYDQRESILLQRPELIITIHNTAYMN